MDITITIKPENASKILDSIDSNPVTLEKGSMTGEYQNAPIGETSAVILKNHLKQVLNMLVNLHQKNTEYENYRAAIKSIQAPQPLDIEDL